MGDDLRWVLILISAVVIGALLIHGLWSVRKRSQNVDNTASRTQPHEGSQDQDDANVLGSVEDTSGGFSAMDDEPSFGDIDVEADTQEQLETEQTDSDEQDEQPSDFVIIHVHMPEGLQMQGSKLLPLLLTLGFKYGDDGFFHRHEQSSGQGAILFRMVNMYNPGTFDVDNMERFSTAGVSLFMTLPNEGEPMATFNMLHNAAKKLAEEFGAELLDHKREPLSVNTVREYVEKVRQYA